MKKILISFCFLLVLQICKSQDKQLQWGIGPGLTIPTGALQFGNGIGFGAEINANYTLSENISINGQTGYSFFSGKYIFGEKNSSAGFIPILAGLRYSSKGLLIGMNLGLGMWNFGEGDKESGFTFRPQFGYDLGKFEILAGYTSTSTSGLNANYFGITSVFKL